MIRIFAIAVITCLVVTFGQSALASRGTWLVPVDQLDRLESWMLDNGWDGRKEPTYYNYRYRPDNRECFYPSRGSGRKRNRRNF